MVAFDLLTPAYQVESDGLDGYQNFWDSVSNVRVESAEADVENLMVTYTYTYNRRGAGNESDTVLMQLEQNDDGFLIADADTIG